MADPIASRPLRPLRPVRPGLIGLLAATAGLTGVALWWESAPADAAGSAAVDRPPGPMGAVALAAPDRLPAALPQLSLPAMVQDPFFGAEAPIPPPLPAAPPPPVVEMVPAPPPPPAAPPADYRYLGRFVGTEGSSRHFVAQGEQHHELAVGGQLPGGYLVESVGPASIRLRHAVLDTVAEIPIPPPPEAAR